MSALSSEQALRKTNAKFRRRFAHVEAGLREQGKTPAGANVAEMEELWGDAKKKEANVESGR